MEYLSPKDGGPLQSAIGLPSFRLKAICFLALLTSGTAVANLAPTVRVLVEREKHELRINGFDLVLSDATTGKVVARAGGRSSLPVKCSLGGKMRIRSAGLKLEASGPLHVESLGGFIRVGGSQYRDDLYVYSFNGDCIVVNHVDLEKYVAGLLNSEMSAKWSLETLKAQAIAARTYALYQMQESSSVRYRSLRPVFDLDSSVRDQVYEGAHQERYRALRAVHETRGQILTYDGKPIKAFYHSTCAGHTEDPERVWGVKYPYLRPVACQYCMRSPRFNWALSLTDVDLEKKLRTKSFVKGRLLDIRVASRNGLGRAKDVEIRGSHGNVVVRATKLRDLLGTAALRSTDFVVARAAAGRFTFVGHGSGHGVGMCQWGAKTMGETGRTYAQILKYYYPEAGLSRLY